MRVYVDIWQATDLLVVYERVRGHAGWVYVGMLGQAGKRHVGSV